MVGNGVSRPIAFSLIEPGTIKPKRGMFFRSSLPQLSVLSPIVMTFGRMDFGRIDHAWITFRANARAEGSHAKEGDTNHRGSIDDYLVWFKN
jgi:hypothetical protein